MKRNGHGISTMIILDTRREKNGGLFPVKLRVYDAEIQRKKLYNLGMDLLPAEFHEIFEVRNQAEPYGRAFDILSGQRRKAMDIINQMEVFEFDLFEKKFLVETGARKNIFHFFEERITEFEKSDKVSSRDIYKGCMKMMKNYLKLNGRSEEALMFSDITTKWLREFEEYQLGLGRSDTTVSIYSRSIQALFNKAIEEGDVKRELYPFGRKKYRKPPLKKVKKALNAKAMEALFICTPKNAFQEKARDFWFLSFVLAGMNMKDIAYLKWSNIDGDRLVYIRQKTRLTSQTDLHEISIPLSHYVTEMISKYGNENTGPDQYVFDILKPGMTEKEKIRTYRNFMRLINQHLQRLAKSLEIPVKISTNWARHSFSTFGINQGYSMEMIAEVFDHSDPRVTKGYFSGLEDQTKDNMVKRITNLDAFIQTKNLTQDQTNKT
jgi:integrase/recombinase XerD